MKKKINIQKTEVNELIKEYINAAIEHSTASRDGNYKVANSAHDCIAAVYRELRSRGVDAQRALLPLLNDQRMGVRSWAAAHVLEFQPNDAVKVLEQLVTESDSLESLSAEMVLQEWRAGTLRFP